MDEKAEELSDSLFTSNYKIGESPFVLTVLSVPQYILYEVL